jgi:hypothetical protein
MHSRTLVNGLAGFTTVGIIIYWASVFLGAFMIPELVPGYRMWFFSFPLPDAWIAGCAAAAVWFNYQRRELGALFGVLTGSSLIFLGLYALLYGINSGLLFQMTVDELIEIAIKLYCLGAGTVLIIHSWRLRTAATYAPHILKAGTYPQPGAQR